MTDTYMPAIIGDTEIQARGMINAYHANQEWSPARQMALAAWTACWSLALSPDRFNAVANALNPHETPVDLQAELTRMVRGGLLRSRKGPLGRIYELAL